MCGRFALFSDIKTIMKYADVIADGFQWTPHYNISPTMNIPLLLRDNNQTVLTQARWEFIPHFVTEKPKYNLINARAETINEKGIFKHSFQKKRCLIIANGFYEWRAKDKQPFYITVKQQPLCFFAGIYNKKDEQYNCAIITTDANQAIKQLHHRMPVIIKENSLLDYLVEKDEDKVKRTMLLPYSDEEIGIITVSKAVNNSRHNSPSLLEERTEEISILF